jgi:hypothetical protein
VSYTILNKAGKYYKHFPKYSIYYLLSGMQITTPLHDVRCKQIYGYHINILCIFVIEKDISFDKKKVLKEAGLLGF